MSEQRLSDLQRAIRNLVYNRAATIPEDRVEISEGMRSRSDLRPEEGGDDRILILQLIPLKPEFCPIEFYVGPEDYRVEYGKFTGREFHHWMLQPVVQPTSYVEVAEDYLEAVVNGKVIETVRTRHGRIVRRSSVLYLSTGPFRFVSYDRMVDDWLSRMFRDWNDQEIVYKSYSILRE
ncbi:MAG: hypothetical protein WCL39_06040 [Armatimonadota bacterium]